MFWLLCAPITWVKNTFNTASSPLMHSKAQRPGTHSSTCGKKSSSKIKLHASPNVPSENYMRRRMVGNLNVMTNRQKLCWDRFVLPKYIVVSLPDTA
jgi:hypothetical protein